MMKRLTILIPIIFYIHVFFYAPGQTYKCNIFVGCELDTLILYPDSVTYSSPTTKGCGHWVVEDNKIHIEFYGPNDLISMLPNYPGSPPGSLYGYYMDLNIENDGSLSNREYIFDKIDRMDSVIGTSNTVKYDNTSQCAINHNHSDYLKTIENKSLSHKKC